MQQQCIIACLSLSPLTIHRRKRAGGVSFSCSLFVIAFAALRCSLQRSSDKSCCYCCIHAYFVRRELSAENYFYWPRNMSPDYWMRCETKKQSPCKICQIPNFMKDAKWPNEEKMTFCKSLQLAKTRAFFLCALLTAAWI